MISPGISKWKAFLPENAAQNIRQFHVLVICYTGSHKKLMAAPSGIPPPPPPIILPRKARSLWNKNSISLLMLWAKPWTWTWGRGTWELLGASSNAPRHDLSSYSACIVVSSSVGYQCRAVLVLIVIQVEWELKELYRKALGYLVAAWRKPYQHSFNKQECKRIRHSENDTFNVHLIIFSSTCYFLKIT